ncbi:MAG: EamA family transporter [Candidatus Bathyarchaeota archaeon]|nr:MAG: EamA family transporter [Candidatus Bathyarchaeota archaeon]
MQRGRLVAILEAFLVTFLWSSSYILVKIGLTQIRPLTLVTLRYIIASVALMSLALQRGGLSKLRDARTLSKLVFLGLTGFAVAQGLQCLGLYYLPAVTVTFILNFTPVMVLVMGVLVLGERPNRLQIGGMGLVLLGAYLFFGDPLLGPSSLGVLVTLISGLGWGSYLVFSRLMFVKEEFDLLGLTAISMGSGTLMMASATLFSEGLSSVPLQGWGIIAWLGLVNTALAFFIWNHALQRLEAFETAILQNTMLIQIAVLSWLFLGERLTGIKLVAMAMVFSGVLTVQLKR